MDFHAFRLAARTLFADDASDVSKAGEKGDSMRSWPSIRWPSNSRGRFQRLEGETAIDIRLSRRRTKL